MKTNQFEIIKRLYTEEKKPSLGVYITETGMVYSEPDEVNAMLKWIVNKSENDKLESKIIKVLKKYEVDTEVHDSYDPIIGVLERNYENVAKDIVELLKED